MDTPVDDRPSTPRAEYNAAAPDITLLRDLLAGTRRMRDQHKLYVPKFPAEKPASYKKRATAAKVYGGLTRTLSASVGMLFAKPPAQSDTWTPEIIEQWENIDGRGTHGDVLSKRKSEDSIADGFTAILVDHPPAPTDVVVHSGNEKSLNLRPLWMSYARADILSWRTATINNVETLTQVVLREGSTVSSGTFGTKAVVQYRVCSLVTRAPADGNEPQLMAVWELVEERAAANGGTVSVVSVATGDFRNKSGEPFQEIPLAICYAGRTDATLCAHPPLLDVAWANLEHWLISNTLLYYADLCGFPQPTVEGEIAPDANGITPPFQLGPGVLVKVTAGSKFTWSEVSGASFASIAAMKDVCKDEMAEMGASFLAKKTRGVETAEAKRLDATAENSTLATAAQGIEDGINMALGFHAMYLGIPKEQAPTITINRDFDNISLDAATMAVYVQAVAQAGLPPRILLQAWQDGGRIGADVDLDALEIEINANIEATKQAKQAELAAQQNKTSPSGSGQ